MSSMFTSYSYTNMSFLIRDLDMETMAMAIRHLDMVFATEKEWLWREKDVREIERQVDVA